MSDGTRSKNPTLQGPIDNLREGATNFVAAAADGLNNLLDGGQTNPLPLPVSQTESDDSDVDGDVASDGDTLPPTTTDTTTTTITTTTTTSNSTNMTSQGANQGANANVAGNTHTTTTVHQESIYVSDFSATNASKMRQFFRTLKLSLKIKYTSETTGPPTEAFLNAKCVEQWRGHVKTNDEAAKALTLCCSGLTDWEQIQAVCLGSVRGCSATDARRATLVFPRTSRWVTQNYNEEIPNDRCQNCTRLRHKTADCRAAKPWCPKHQRLGHKWADCKARKKAQPPATAPSTA